MFKGNRLEILIKRFLNAKDIKYEFIGYEGIFEEIEQTFEKHVTDLEFAKIKNSRQAEVEAIVLDLLRREKLIKVK